MYFSGQPQNESVLADRLSLVWRPLVVHRPVCSRASSCLAPVDSLIADSTSTLGFLQEPHKLRMQWRLLALLISCAIVAITHAQGMARMYGTVVNYK